jgi:uncharacterized membrane protein YccC
VGLVRYAAAGLIVGAVLSSPLPHSRGTMLGALAGLLVAAATPTGSRRVPRANHSRKNPKSLAAARVGSTLFGVLLLAAVSLVVPERLLLSLGIIILFCGIGIGPPYPVIGGGFTTIGSVLLAGAPTGAVGDWAQRRLLDTLLGCAIALAAYLLWPRDRETDEPVPVTT